MTNRLHQILLASLFAALASGVGGLPDSIEFEHILVNPDLGGGDCKGLADVDGDGKLDVIAGNKKDLAWYKFPDWRKTLIAPAKQEFTTDMQVADMDADGDPDMIAPDSENGEIAWFENPRPKGDPAAAPWKRHPVGSQGDWAHDVEVGDMNGDGKLDIVTRKTETLLWLQQPSGSFSKVEILAALPKGEGTALADLNRDGRLDIIQNGYWLQAPRDPANGEWRKHVIADGWPAQLGVAAADVNGDDRLDVLIGPAESHGRLAWYEAPADPVKGEWKEHVIDGDVEFLHTFQTSDMDNNGVLDIVTAEMHQSKQKRITVYFQFNQSSGPTIWPRQVIAQTGSHNLRAGDIDGDGDIDILGANWGGSHAPLEVWMNKLIDRSRMRMDSAWTYTRVDGKRAKWGDFDPPSWMKYFGLAAGNIDGRGALDVASGRYFYRSPAQGLAGPWERVTFPLNVDAMLMLDVDGDGRADVIGEALPKVYWLKPLDREGKSWKPFVIANLPPTDHVNGQGYALGQIIPGGQPEPVLAVGHAIYYLQVPPNPQAGEWPKVRVAQGTSEEGVAAADIDRDGRVDIVASAQDGKRLLWFKNPGDGSPDWKQSDIASVERFADRVAIADFNGDKRLDVAVSEETWPDAGPASVFWFEQPSAPDQPWTRHKVVTQYTTNAMDVADMNGDGVPDIITGEHRATRKLAIWQNTGHGRSWTERVVDTGKESHLGARAMDLDGDGKPEILSICWDTYWNLHLWRPASAARK